MSEVTPEQAAQILQAEQRKRAEAFKREYEELCQKHKCELVGMPGFTNDGRIAVQLRVNVNNARGSGE